MLFQGEPGATGLRGLEGAPGTGIQGEKVKSLMVVLRIVLLSYINGFFYSLQKYNALMFRETKDREESEA